MTDEQMTLDDAAKVADVAWMRDEETIQAAFERFHMENPDVYRLLVRFARQLKARGYEHAGISLIWERMRWEVAISTSGDDPFKLNNNYRSRYARVIMANEPDLRDFFRTRELQAE